MSKPIKLTSRRKKLHGIVTKLVKNTCRCRACVYLSIDYTWRSIYSVSFVCLWQKSIHNSQRCIIIWDWRKRKQICQGRNKYRFVNSANSVWVGGGYLHWGVYIAYKILCMCIAYICRNVQGLIRIVHCKFCNLIGLKGYMKSRTRVSSNSTKTHPNYLRFVDICYGVGI